MAQGLARQGGWYLFAGVSAALIELGLFELLFEAAGVPLAAANIIAVVVATVYNFLVNRNVTFQSASNPVRSMVLYALLFAVNLCITTAAISAMVSAGVNSALAKLIMQACVAVWNFFLYRHVVFK